MSSQSLTPSSFNKTHKHSFLFFCHKEKSFLSFHVLFFSYVLTQNIVLSFIFFRSVLIFSRKNLFIKELWRLLHSYFRWCLQLIKKRLLCKTKVADRFTRNYDWQYFSEKEEMDVRKKISSKQLVLTTLASNRSQWGNKTKQDVC
jgi:hypothetical protein